MDPSAGRVHAPCADTAVFGTFSNTVQYHMCKHMQIF